MSLKNIILYAILLLIASILLSEVTVQSHELKGQVITHQNGDCNIFHGSWVDKPYPSYDQCVRTTRPFFSCQQNKTHILKRWQPSSCDLPRFDGLAFLREMSGKRIMFVGDDLSYNQWDSLVCMINHGQEERFYIEIVDELLNYTVPDFQTSILYDMSRPFLADIKTISGRGQVLKLESMTRGQLWKDQDVLIFNIWHSWHHMQVAHVWSYIQIGNTFVRRMKRLDALEMMLRTWAKWVDENINPSKTKVFFVGVVPNHIYGYQWGNQTAKSCVDETEPVLGTRYPSGPDPMEDVVKKVLRTIRKKIHFLDVTLLSQLRKDGHPGSYDKYLVNCDLWCLPGVPDTWNELLNAVLLHGFSASVA